MSLTQHNELLVRAETILHQLAHDFADGNLRRALEHHLKSGGKRLRLKLAVEATVALQGDHELASGWGAACELLHNATLVHDDLQDGDTHRRGHPTVWSVFGTNEAINAGDFMLMLPFTALRLLPPTASDTLRWQLAEALASSALNTVQGQSGELELPQHLGTSELKKSYIRCIDQKTSSLFELPVKGAALIAGRSVEEATELARAIRPLGTLFQIQDDVLDLFGDKGRDLRGADLREGKLSSLVVEHLALYPSDRTELLKVLHAKREDTREEDVTYWTARFESGGALKAALNEINTRRAAIEKSEALAANPELRIRILDLLEMVLKPIHHLGVSHVRISV